MSKSYAGNVKEGEVLLRIHAVLPGVSLSDKLSFDSIMGQWGILPYISIFTALLSYCPVKRNLIPSIYNIPIKIFPIILGIIGQ